MANTDPDALEAALRAWAAPRLAEDADIPALAADGVRPTGRRAYRGANRNTPDGVHFETVTLVTHGGRPLASRGCRDEGGEAAALRALLEDVDLRGCVLTLDALHAARDTGRAVVETHGADYVLAVKANCPDTFAQLAAIDWDAGAVRRHADEPVKAHGRIEARRVAARDLIPETLAPFPDARQAFRVLRERTNAKTGRTSTETAYGITSVPAERAGPGRLLAWNRGHWLTRERQPLPRAYPRAAICQHGRGRRALPRGPRPGQPRHAQQHRARRGLPPRLPLPARSQPPLHDAPRRRPRSHPLARLSTLAALPGGRRHRPAILRPEPRKPRAQPSRNSARTPFVRRIPRRATKQCHSSHLPPPPPSNARERAITLSLA